MKLSVVIPVRDEAPVIPELIPRLTGALDDLDLSWEAIFVDDGSRDSTWALLEVTAERDERIRALRFTRNFGHEVALTAGLHVASGEAVVAMDGDLQHPPELLPALVAKAGEGFEVVYAIRSASDGAGWLKRHSARLFYWLLNRLTALDLPPGGGGDFWYMSRPVVDALLAMPERTRFLRAMTRWVGYEQTSIEYDRAPRAGGRSKYSVRKLFTVGWDAIVSFSSLPLRIASMLGFAFSFLGLIYLVYVLVVRLFTDEAVAGWASVAATVLILGGVQLLCLGIIGQYLGRMYDEIKNRPLFFVAEDTSRREVGAGTIHTP